MKISSPVFSHNQKIPSKFTCDGENVNPPLVFQDIQKETKSLVLIVDDPDAPSKTWVHWVVFNINPTVKEVAENSIPKLGVQGLTDFGKPGYGGPCPPASQPGESSGVHRYFFKLYALDTSLNLSGAVSKNEIEKVIEDHVLDKAELIGLYSRR